jgi:hypothetical protein
MDYKNLISPVDKLPKFEEYVEPFCNAMQRKIADLQHKHEIEVKKQSIASRGEVRKLWPEYAIEYKKLLVKENSSSACCLTSNSKATILNTSDDEEQAFMQPLSSEQLTSEEPDQQPTFSPNFNNQNFRPNCSVAEFRGDPLVKEVVAWKINLAQGVKVKSWKLLFFQSVLLRLTFGYNSQTNSFFTNISPAEKLKCDVKFYCQVRIHDPKSSTIMVTHSPAGNYTYHRDAVVPLGVPLHEQEGTAHLAGVELLTSAYLDNHLYLHLTVFVASELGQFGELRGVNM